VLTKAFPPQVVDRAVAAAGCAGGAAAVVAGAVGSNQESRRLRRPKTPTNPPPPTSPTASNSTYSNQQDPANAGPLGLRLVITAEGRQLAAMARKQASQKRVHKARPRLGLACPL